jgi:hypothetical protein
MEDETFILRSRMLEEAVTELSAEDRLPLLPNVLHHYTTLDTSQKILEGDDIRLSHAECSNDQRELEQAKTLIQATAKAYSPDPPFAAQVLAGFLTQAFNLDAYIFCMSTGDLGANATQDVLSQWRAYGHDGRGACISLDPKKFADLVWHLPGLRINPVIYDQFVAQALINLIITKGSNLHSSGNVHAIDATVAALVFIVPIVKDVGFKEEKEWRLIFMPPGQAPQPQLGFFPRRDFLAPYVTLKELWDNLRPKLTHLASPPPINKRTPPKPVHLIPALNVMVGPSGHQPLNERALIKMTLQAGRSISVLKSSIPYRSLS